MSLLQVRDDSCAKLCGATLERMVLTVDVPIELGQRLEAEAKRQGTAPMYMPEVESYP